LCYHLIKIRKDYDLIYLQVPDIFGLCTVLSAKILRKPVVLKFVGDIAWEFASNTGRTKDCLDEFHIKSRYDLLVRILILMQKFIFKSVNVIITPSHYLKDVLVRFYHIEPSKIKVIYNSISIDNNINFNEKNRKTACVICRLTPWKGVDGVIKAVYRVINLSYDIKLLIVGEGPEKEKLEKIVEDLSIKEHVIFLGRKKRDEVLEILRNASLFILNSKYEGLPHVVLEAMACGTLVIATNIKCMKEIIIENKTGLLVKIENEDDLIEKIIYALNEEKDMKKMIIRAYDLVKRKFSWEKNLELLERVFKRVF